MSEARETPRAEPWTLALLAFAAIFLVLNIKLVAGVVAMHWDGEDFFAPAFSLIADHARAGTVVLWNPWIAGGSPDHAEPELGTASPIAIAVGLLAGGSEAGFRAYWLLIWILGPLGILVLARHLRAPAWGGFIAALGFAFSGLYTGHAEHTSSLYAISFLPFVIWRLDAALRSGRIWPAVEAGGLWGLSALGGYPQLTILTGGYVFLWALGRCCCPEREEPGSEAVPTAQTPTPGFASRFLFAMAAVVAVAAVGIVVLSPSYLAYFTEAFGYSDRVGPRPRHIAIGLQPFAVGALSTLSSPYLPVLKIFGNPGLWEMTDVSMSSVYLGASIFVFGLFALAARPRCPWRWWLAGIGVLFLLGAFGERAFLRGWLYDVFPPTRYFRNPALFRAYAMFSLVVLALLGTRDLRAELTAGRVNLGKRLLWVAAVSAVGAVVAYARIIGRVQSAGPYLAGANVHLVIVWGGAVVIAALASTGTARRQLPAFLVALALIDAGGAFRLSQPVMYTTATRARWDRINRERKPALPIDSGLMRDLRPPEWLGPQLNNRNVPLRIATFANYVTMANRFHGQLMTSPLLAAMATGSDRIWFASDVAMVSPTDAAAAALHQRSRSLGAPAVVVHSREQMSNIQPSGESAPAPHTDSGSEAIAALPAAVRVAAHVVRYEPNRLHLRVVCPASGWLLVTDRWAPGWRATVNGAPAEVLGGNFVFRAIRVNAGASDVDLSYRPRAWLLTLMMSWGTLLALLGYRVARRLRPRR